jgi:UDP-N-acetylmuramoyl-L-alanyl-D-glutamate--2,6-diaminopimelate ligase
MIKYETDSRKIKRGQTFIALKGNIVDGHDFINDAIKNGASEIISEKNIKTVVPLKVVKNTNQYLKNILKKNYASKLNTLKIIGVTGTNGKTTSCYLTYQLLLKLGVKVAYLGTIGFYYNDKIIGTENTTPDILTIYKYLDICLEEGINTIVMEVSSHSLAFERMYGLHIDIGAFTNLTEDHLDYHKTMENYLNCKLKIFDLLTKDGLMIINSDDPYSTYFINKSNKYETIGKNGTYKIIDFKTDSTSTQIIFSYQNKTYNIKTNLTSEFNVYNFLTAVALTQACGFNLESILKYSLDLIPPKGRCEMLKIKKGIVIIDYAHTPDAVEKVLNDYLKLKTNKIITVIGCGGNRDPLKRPIMGDIATKLSDYCILTSDNPRYEDPKLILDDMVKGIKTNNYEVIIDRKMAIKRALDLMQNGDIVLLLGKGHETYQIINNTKYHFDDSEEVLNYQANN